VFRLLTRLKRIIKRKLHLAGRSQNGGPPPKNYIYKSLLILSIALIITLIYPQQLVYQPVELPLLGDIARENVIAPVDFEVKRDTALVQSERDDTLANLPVILDYNYNKYETVYRNVVSFFSTIRQLQTDSLSLAENVDSLKALYPR